MYNPNSTVNKENEKDFHRRNLTEVIDFIITTHHSFVRNALQKIINHSTHIELKNMVEKLYELNHLIEILYRDMHNHMEKEEKVLFPLIKYLVETEKFGERPKTRNYGTVKNPIKQMLSEHETALEIIEKIKNVLTETGKELSDSFFPLITEFETDLHQHIYLENIVLFPRAIELENKLLHN
jgi:regulator of cell morphogenesis and NO signaling